MKLNIGTKLWQEMILLKKREISLEKYKFNMYFEKYNTFSIFSNIYYKCFFYATFKFKFDLSYIIHVNDIIKKTIQKLICDQNNFQPLINSSLIYFQNQTKNVGVEVGKRLRKNN